VPFPGFCPAAITAPGGMLGRGVMNSTRFSGVVSGHRERRSPCNQIVGSNIATV
jgi:hypothetical protein